MEKSPRQMTARMLARMQTSVLPLLLATFASVVLLSAHAEARVDAIYTVPTVSPNLEQAASFPTRSDQNIYGSPEKLGLLRFVLPEELTGLSTQFEISRKADGKWSGVGTDGSEISGTCARENRKWFACKVEFKSLAFDQATRETILGDRFGRGFEFDQRLAVARSFEGQPLGVIKVRIGR